MSIRTNERKGNRIMFSHAGKRATDITIHSDNFNRIIFVSFLDNKLPLGTKEMIGNFLTEFAMTACIKAAESIITAAGYEMAREIRLNGSRINNFFIYRLPKDFRPRHLRRDGTFVTRIIIACHYRARKIVVTYLGRDAAFPDPRLLFELGEDEIENIPTLIDFEFLIYALRRFFALQENYIEIINTHRLDGMFNDYFVFEYAKPRLP